MKYISPLVIHHSKLIRAINKSRLDLNIIDNVDKYLGYLK